MERKPRKSSKIKKNSPRKKSTKNIPIKKSSRKKSSIFDGVKRKLEEAKTHLTLPDELKNILTFLPDEEKKIKDLLLKDEKSILDFLNEEDPLNVKFAILIISFTIYDRYCSESELNIDLIKKLKVYFCINPEELQEELSDLQYHINPELSKIIGKHAQVSPLLRDKIKQKKLKLEKTVEYIKLINGSTEKINTKNINVLDCEFDSLFERLEELEGITLYVTTNQIHDELRNIVVYGFEKKINNFILPLYLEYVDYFLPSLSEVGDDWMHKSQFLKEVNFAGLGQLVEVGMNWMSNCRQLYKINFVELKLLKKVGINWLSYCSNLERIDFNGLSSLTTVCGYWMNDCYRLESISYKSMKMVETVGNRWMLNCTNLRTVDFSDLSSLETVGDDWMYRCSKLKTITFKGLSSLKTVGNSWMMFCESTTINFSGLSSLKTVGNEWLCSSELETPIFVGLSELKTVGEYWMEGCKNLKEPDFNGLSKLETVGDCWMLSCNQLIRPKFIGLLSLKTVGDYWMFRCYSLISPNFNGLSKLENVGTHWMAECDLLKTPDFSALKKSLKTVGANWLFGCKNLTLSNFRGLFSHSFVTGAVLRKSKRHVSRFADSDYNICFYPTHNQFYASPENEDHWNEFCIEKNVVVKEKIDVFGFDKLIHENFCRGIRNWAIGKLGKKGEKKYTGVLTCEHEDFGVGAFLLFKIDKQNSHLDTKKFKYEVYIEAVCTNQEKKNNFTYAESADILIQLLKDFINSMVYHEEINYVLCLSSVPEAMEAYYKKSFRFEKYELTGLTTMFYFPLPSFYVIDVKTIPDVDETTTRIKKIHRSLKNLVSGVKY